MAENCPNVVQLAPRAAAYSEETVQTLEFYTDQARKGAIVGAAVILLKPSGYDLDVIGEAGAQPEYVLGLIKLLDLQLVKIIESA